MAEAATTGWKAIETVCGIVCNYATYVYDLKDHVPALKTKMDMLRKKETYVKRLVRSKQTPHLDQTPVVKEWLDRVHQLYSTVEEVIAERQEEIDHRVYRCCFPKYCCAFTRVGQKVNKNLEEVKQTIKDGEFKEVVKEKEFIPAEEIPLLITFGFDNLTYDICKRIVYLSICRFGIYGTRSGGKTTILTKIHNMFCHELTMHDYDKVIWIDRLDDKFIFQEIMSRKLEIPNKEWKRTLDRGSLILQYARLKKYILLVDDLRLDDLETIVLWGFPCDGDSRIIFTLSSRISNIHKQEIFDLWYAEGLLGGDGDTYSSIGGSPVEYDIVETRLGDERILKFLKQAGLIVDGQSEDSIKMRIVIHKAALWLERVKGQMVDQLLLHDEVEEIMEKSSPSDITTKRIFLDQPKSIPSQEGIHYSKLTTFSAKLDTTQSSKFLIQAVALRVLNAASIKRSVDGRIVNGGKGMGLVGVLPPYG
ncbi:hypothetical protein Tsubulata_040392 [Turnera subulata]|uniref:NB-ARC domain-containing protein n=1 Tax=Turnera subulata TaxID=218843 RepID=A0A9Q0FQ26_9ROSI|nr:hypothetical protein Tsubulata_040392 [Turnera subulata]